MEPNISETTPDLLNSIYGTLFMEAGGISIAQIVRYTNNFDISSSFDISFRVKAISLAVSLILIAFVVILIIKARRISIQKIDKMAEAFNPPSTVTQPGPLLARWGEITRHVNSNKELEWKFAVIEADKLLDELLKSMGYPGETMGERLMSIDSSKLTALNHLWEAHKIRNKIVHEPDYFLRNVEARGAIDGYKRALEELQAIN